MSDMCLCSHCARIFPQKELREYSMPMLQYKVSTLPSGRAFIDMVADKSKDILIVKSDYAHNVVKNWPNWYGGGLLLEKKIVMTSYKVYLEHDGQRTELGSGELTEESPAPPVANLLRSINLLKQTSFLLKLKSHSKLLLVSRVVFM